jgi:hypothetical protein
MANCRFNWRMWLWCTRLTFDCRVLFTGLSISVLRYCPNLGFHGLLLLPVTILTAYCRFNWWMWLCSQWTFDCRVFIHCLALSGASVLYESGDSVLYESGYFVVDCCLSDRFFWPWALMVHFLLPCWFTNRLVVAYSYTKVELLLNCLELSEGAALCLIDSLC